MKRLKIASFEYVVFVLLLVAVMATLSLVIGCGGNRTASASTVATGRAVLTVRWPERSRLIPFAAESITVRIARGTQLFGEKVLVRPSNGGTASVTFDRVPTGSATVTATAYPRANGSGVAQATGTVPVTVQANATTDVRLTLGSTIRKLTLTPAKITLKVGESTTPTVTAYNASNEVVLITLATMTWSSDHAELVSVEAGGKLNAQGVGTATITVTDTESKKTATCLVTVVSNATPTPTPTPTPEAKCDSATRHCYEAVTVGTQITWYDARTAAEGRTYNGMKGHLVTVTSQAETDFLFANFTLHNYWLGGFQNTSSPDFSEPTGGWKWVTGEPWSYTNWHSGEPNNANPDENFLQFWDADNGRWNDMQYNHPIDTPLGYVVEYEPVSSGLLAYEGFDYSEGDGVLGKAGGYGLSVAGWTENTAQGSTPTEIVAGSLTYRNLKTSGNAAQSTSLYPFGNFRQLLHPEGQVATGKVTYVSVLIHPLEPFSGWPDTYFMVGSSDLGIGKGGSGADWCLETSGGRGHVGTGIVAKPNETAFLVARHTFLDGADKIEMWVNPIPGQPLPKPDAVKTDQDIAEMGMGFGGSIHCLYDEYRIGTTWESVSPTK